MGKFTTAQEDTIGMNETLKAEIESLGTYKQDNTTNKTPKLVNVTLRQTPYSKADTLEASIREIPNLINSKSKVLKYENHKYTPYVRSNLSDIVKYLRSSSEAVFPSGTKEVFNRIKNADLITHISSNGIESSSYIRSFRRIMRQGNTNIRCVFFRRELHQRIPLA